jgi:hypothetical protein
MASPLQVQKIACVNDAGFVMSFELEFLDPGTGHWVSTANSGDYPIDQTRTIDGQSVNLPAGVSMRPQVHAVLGVTHEGDPVEYQANGQTATYEVKGTTLFYSVKLIG